MSIKIKIFGNRVDTPDSELDDRSFELSSFRSSDTKAHEIEIKEDELTEFQFDDDTIWFAQPDEIPDLFDSLNRSNDDVLEIPSHLSIPGGDRNVAKKVFISLIRVFKPKATKETALALARKIESQILEKEGVNFIDEEFKMTSFEEVANRVVASFNENAPFLLFIHGTGSSTTGSFSEMKGTDTWVNLCKEYGNNILALEHRTWSKSPLENAIVLLKVIPENAKLHLVSH